MSAPEIGLTASVIVRSMNKASTIERTLQSLRHQAHPVEIIVVDSGSRDGTVEIAHRFADKLLQITPEEFSYGYALNLGADAAVGDVHFALSAHCTAPTPTWISDSLRHYADERVAGTNGSSSMPNGTPIQTCYQPTLDEALANTVWGFSNHAGSWRARTWREQPFREDLLACEDKEWFWRVLRAGWKVSFDPLLNIPSTHRRQAGVRALWTRTHREAEALASLGFPPKQALTTTLHSWWCDFPNTSRLPKFARRLSPYRAAEHWAAHTGSLAGSKGWQCRESHRTDTK